MQELTYEIPFERLSKLGRTMGRRAFRGMWLLRWGLFTGYLAALVALSFYADAIDRWFNAQGMPSGSLLTFLTVTAIVLIVTLRLRKRQKQEIKARANFDLSIRLNKTETGIHIETDEIGYILKWRGINQMLLEPDGVVISHGGLFFLVPNLAFSNMADRNAFIRDVYAQLGDEAKARSEDEIRPVLDGTVS
ncbi:MAG: hypothetical protein KTR19_08575 [Hyphomicrobiales bacterium]|nr:hypothetical protein [Hyphomicrobiales bacterium]